MTIILGILLYYRYHGEHRESDFQRREKTMSRKTLQKNLSYDEQRNLFYVTSQISGQRHSRTYPTYDDALAALYPGVSHDISADGKTRPSPTATLGEWLDWWLTEDVAPSRAESTAYGYRNIVRHHLLPILGDVPLAELSPLLLQTYLSIKLGEGLSPNTVLKHYTLLHAALGQAVKLRLMPVDPSRQVTPPRREPSRYTCYSPQQLRILFQATEGTTLGLAVRLAAYLGLRRSEITGLRWQCVDLKAQVVLIQEVRTEVGGREVLKEPKTRRSLRRLGISGCTELIAELERAWTARKSDNPAEFVLLRADGTPPSPDLLTRQMARVTECHHLPKITLHGLRHSFASIANSQHIPMHDISHILGHSSITVTSTIYTHLFDETESSTLRTVAESIWG